MTANTGEPSSITISEILLSDGQFVYGPNVNGFDVREYVFRQAPHLADYADDLYGRSERYSINPKLVLTLLELSAGLMSGAKTPAVINNPFGLTSQGLIQQVEIISAAMTEAYYRHLNLYSALPPSQRNLPGFTLPDGTQVEAPAFAKAGTYALMAGLAKFQNASEFTRSVDPANPAGFRMTYMALFPGDDPLDESNQIRIPDEVQAAAAPAGLLQLPFLRGESWQFNGVHDTYGRSSNNDMSSIDFSPGWPALGADTSNS
jgi:hypothetical protein